MTTARHADLGDIDEIVRLREILLAPWFDTTDTGWKAETAAILHRRLDEPKPTMAVTVIDAPDGSGALASCATGVISERLPNPGNPSGRYGWVFNVVTDPRWRGRGHSRACTSALLDWFEDQSVTVIELLASKPGEGLYRELGFTVSEEPAMRLNTRRRMDS
ncbi:GNAT family N-acetyltransferase [Glycomyces sp. TRM65418]|uniref:GNAT family N-acetyltransferase n=1 Tax=Glycomyces sp. TRM65418 TaxID=2867006 RepID=UPI001CE6EC06|nr:GNAT family N-acetyltransferase [Glycomyces sp. TRM65418]MCC3763512.1 GNAT family N-acetyltransferase [Glycomyces sp. TRM65418]QZD57496.1 GNAT family N-acetyltransferase [Glycomyces sp. TRM65418]